MTSNPSAVCHPPSAFDQRHRRRVVITGIGPVAACGVGLHDFWAGSLAQKSLIRRVTAFDTSLYKASSCGVVPDWNPLRFFPPHRLKRLDRYAQFAVASALLALEDATLPWAKDRMQDRVGVSFGSALGGIANAETEHTRFLEKGPRGVHQTLGLQVFGGSGHANIAIECGFRGPGITNCNSCASGVVAVGEALRYIRDGMADVMIAGGAEAPLSPLTFGAFDFIHTMSRFSGEPAHLACRPFDAERDGFVMGEGACSLVLEEFGHATARGAHIYAEVLGYALNNDAYHMTSPHPDGYSVTRCMTDALANAGVAPEQIDYINPHASSTQLNDANEIACIKRVFGDHARKLCMSGTKPYTAHPFGASGALETAICALAIDRDFLPPTLNHQTTDPACDLDIIPNAGRHQRIDYALNNAFGFGGINSAIVLGRPAPQTRD
jgi:3-oxoacyl-[acyl-carrier-protein] synthase II